MSNDLPRQVRALGGALAIITLLGLLVGDFFFPNRSISPETIAVLIGLIGALLSVDIGIAQLGLEVKTTTIEDDEGGED